MLAIIFTTLALGLQNGIYHKHGEEWIPGTVEAEMNRGNVYSKTVEFQKEWNGQLLIYN